MKYIEKMERNENLSWCKPYVDDSGEYALIMQEGKAICIKTPYGTAYEYGTLDDAALEEFARAVNPDYNLYSGWDDTHIALEAMHPVGCFFCPFKDECEAVNEKVDDD